MCLLTYQKEPIILTEDKIVWKLLREESSIEASSIYQSFLYELGVLYQTEIKEAYISKLERYNDCAYSSIQGDVYKTEDNRELKEGVISYGCGFHSFYDSEYALRKFTKGIWELYECIIPAGSEYYEDETGLCISDKIIINKKIL